ncbi:MAG: hypothetical protein J0L84_04530, partial [Verrucomicrobia bacterium]|nr:hypothetical protein [Verrucomicrobiota bacterium]
MAAGITNELRVSGQDLEDPAGLLFSDPRIQATAHDSQPMTFVVRVPAEVDPGMVEVRWAGRFGVSNPRPLVISSGPEWTLQPTNTARADALDFPWDTGVLGRLPAAQSLWFRCSGEPGARASVRVLASELGSRLEPVLRWCSDSGGELGSIRGSCLDFVMPASGRCLVQLQDATYRGGDEHLFRLVATRAPHIGLVLPGVLRAGETNRVTLFGRRLPGGKSSPLDGPDGRPWEMLETEIIAPPLAHSNAPPFNLPRRAASAPLAAASMRWEWASSNGVSNPVLLALTEAPVVSIPPGTSGPGGSLTPVRPPVEFSGLFPRRGEQGGVTFEARKGDVYWVEVWAERLGFPCDPRVIIQRQRGTRGEQGETLYADVLELNDHEANPGGTEFSTVSRDPAGRFEAPEDGTYRMLVWDLFHTAARGGHHPYRLALRRESPDFSLAVLPMPPVRANDNDRAVHAVAPFLRRGQTELLKVIA